MNEFKRGEITGIIKVLKWVQFIMTYKALGDVKREIEYFISKAEKEGEEFQNLDRY